MTYYRGSISSMSIVMSLGFGEGGDAGDRGTVSKQATRGHEVYPGSGPRRENPTLACLLLITTKPKSIGFRKCNLGWGFLSVVRGIPPPAGPSSLYIEIGGSQAQ